MKRCIFSFLFVFAVALSAKAICVQRNYREAPVHPRTFHLSASTQVNHGSDHFPCGYFLETSDYWQIFRKPVRRIASFVKDTHIYAEKFSVYFNTFIILFPHVSTGFVSSCKLMLYPFHAYW